MSARKRTKKSRHRAGSSHGWGEKKHHRKAGSRGGRGRAGSGKMADQKKPMYWAEGRKPKQGFSSKSMTKVNSINIADISLMIEHGKFQKKGTYYEVDLQSLGYTKLLSKGVVKLPMNITVANTTEKAVEKVTGKGGKITKPNETE
jgi:large subunit ribosomal protein L15